MKKVILVLIGICLTFSGCKKEAVNVGEINEPLYHAITSEDASSDEGYVSEDLSDNEPVKDYSKKDEINLDWLIGRWEDDKNIFYIHSDGTFRHGYKESEGYNGKWSILDDGTLYVSDCQIYEEDPWSTTYKVKACLQDRLTLIDENGWVCDLYKETTSKNESPQFICWITSKEGLKVRDTPDLNGRKISLLDYKSKVDVYEIGKKAFIDNKHGFWLKIKTGGTYGWIFSGYVTVIPETPYNKKELLPLTNENLAGTWTQSESSFFITEFLFGEVFQKDGRCYSGLLSGSMGTLGNYEIDSAHNEVIVHESVIDDTYMEENPSIYRLNIKRLTRDELVYDYIDENTSNSETKNYRRIPSQFLELKDASTIDWLRYINKYGNEELFTGSTVFMYAISCQKNDVALFLINSNIDINHKNHNGEKASDYFGNNEDEYLFEILKPETTEHSFY